MNAASCLNSRTISLATLSKHSSSNTARRYQTCRNQLVVSSLPVLAPLRVLPLRTLCTSTSRFRTTSKLGPLPRTSITLQLLQRDGVFRRVSHSVNLGTNHQGRKVLRSQISSVFYILPLVAVGAYLLYGTVVDTTPESSGDESRIHESFETVFEFDMATALPGRPGNLTPEQEEKLVEFWRLILQVCAVSDGESIAESRGKTSTAESDKPKKKRLGLFKKKDKKDNKENVALATREKAVSSLDGVNDEDPDDKYGQNKLFRETLASRSPESIRESLWAMVKMDHPDQLVLRFLRARKWDVQKALVMLVSTMKWRQDVKVDEDIMANSEEHMLLQEKNGADDKDKKFASDFLAQMRLGKSFCHGIDKEGRPISVVRVRLHRAGEQSNESLERFTIYLIETTRLLLSPPADTGAVIFDMTGFTMANMDYTPVKFMIQCFEANYPESLGVVLVHKAPWIFQGIWKIIRGMLDPVVASKVHFTNSVKDMAGFVPKAKIPTEMDGQDKWSYKYVEPVIGENETMKDTATRDKLLEEREALYEEFEQKTLQWIREKDSEKHAVIKAERNAVATKLREGYWMLDPYIRSKSYYDRIGVLRPGGKLDYYPSEQSAANGIATSADDVD